MKNEIRYDFYFFCVIYSALVKCEYDEKVMYGALHLWET